MFPKAASATIKEFSKAICTHTNERPKAAGKFMKKPGKNSKTSIAFGNPFKRYYG